MIYDKWKEYFDGTRTIYGANANDIQGAKFNLLSDVIYEGEENEEEIKLLKRFEEFFFKAFVRTENGTEEERSVRPFEVVDGKVKIEDGAIYHRCSADMGTLEGVSVAGVLATEWFETWEAEQEGRLCAFATRVNSKSQIRESIMPPYFCKLYFDEQNPIMKMLASLDFFEYQKIRKNNPEKLKEMYPEFIIELYEKIILPLSPSSSKFHDNENSKTFNWIAIPGGFPSSLVNGICISSKNTKLIENIEEIQKLYPQATIFDENNNVLALPLGASKQGEPNVMQ